MKIGIFAKTFERLGAEASLSAVAEAGYDVAQFNLACLGLPSMPDAIEPQTMREVRQASERTKIALPAISGTYNMIHPDPAVRRTGRARLFELCRASAAMGIAMVSLCTGTRDPEDQWRAHPDNATPEAWRDLAAEMAAAIDFAERFDVDLGIEPELANVVSSAARARRLIDELGSERLRIILDPANLFERAAENERRDIIARAVELLADRIAMAHAKDRNPDGSFAVAGRGVIDFVHFVSRLRGAGFDGPLVTHGLAAHEAAGVAVFLRGLTGGRSVR
jgi:sugar phosphate isomerase/epimerase